MQERNNIMSVDAMMDERYGKVGTPEREALGLRYEVSQPLAFG